MQVCSLQCAGAEFSDEGVVRLGTSVGLAICKAKQPALALHEGFISTRRGPNHVEKRLSAIAVLLVQPPVAPSCKQMMPPALTSSQPRLASLRFQQPHVPPCINAVIPKGRDSTVSLHSTRYFAHPSPLSDIQREVSTSMCGVSLHYYSSSYSDQPGKFAVNDRRFQTGAMSTRVVLPINIDQSHH
jgi:hypothetical protein